VQEKTIALSALLKNANFILNSATNSCSAQLDATAGHKVAPEFFANFLRSPYFWNPAIVTSVAYRESA
jgi:hypothetical protein